MKAEVETALAELEEKSPGGAVRHHEDGEGGAWVVVSHIDIGPNFSPSSSAVAFLVTSAYPEAIPYPHIIDAGILYTGDEPRPNTYPDGDLPTAMTRGTFTVLDEPRDGIQVSRSSPRRDPLGDTALAKLMRVLHFLRSHK
jgi:hypothetical protein